MIERIAEEDLSWNICNKLQITRVEVVSEKWRDWQREGESGELHLMFITNNCMMFYRYFVFSPCHDFTECQCFLTVGRSDLMENS